MGDNTSFIRNFCIIAHIDHGKSTLADRLLELTETVQKREMKEQLLDSMDLEREKGITIKLQPVRMTYRHSGDGRKKKEDDKSNPNSSLKSSDLDESPGSIESHSEVYKQVHKASTRKTDAANLQKQQQFTSSASKQADAATTFQLNLIDTPGHVDFSYEVSRSLAAVEGAILVVDASQGIQAQTLANVYLAMEQDLEIIPVLNKVDLPAADVEKVSNEVISLLGCAREDILEISAKTGQNVESVLQAVVERVPPPKAISSENVKALVFDSYLDEYQGVVLYVRMVSGSIDANSDIYMAGTKAEGRALVTGFFSPKPVPNKQLLPGEIGYIVTNFKSVADARVGDTVVLKNQKDTTALPGYKKAMPFVYAGVFPASADDYQDLKDALEKVSLNDAALIYEPENSQILGFGFRVGFLGLLHLEIVQERIERHQGVEIIVTNPSTDYQVVLSSGEEQTIRSAGNLPDPTTIAEIREPWIRGEIIVPVDYVGNVVQLIVSTRGHQKNISYVDEHLATVSFEAPLANVLTDFYDQLKSTTSGYGTLSYEIADYRTQDLVRLDILVGGERMDSLSIMTHKSEAESMGRKMLEKLKEVIPRQLFEVALQAAVGGKILAREDIKALGKNVTGHLYGGDVSRKKKLWAKQKAGKQRMKKFGKVDIPPEAFTVLLKKD